MDVIPLKPELVRGSHGLQPPADKGAVIVGPSPPEDMRQFKNYIRDLLTN